MTVSKIAQSKLKQYYAANWSYDTLVEVVKAVLPSKEPSWWFQEERNIFTGRIKDVLEWPLWFKDQSMSHSSLFTILSAIFNLNNLIVRGKKTELDNVSMSRIYTTIANFKVKWLQQCSNQ